MTKQEHLEELKRTAVGVRKAQAEAVNDILKKDMLSLVQSLTDFKLKLNWGHESSCRIGFMENKQVYFTLSLDGNNVLELSHGLYSNFASVKKWLVETDKIIAKLWDREEEVLAIFSKIKKEQYKYHDTIHELERKICDIEKEIRDEERDNALSQLVVGSKWRYTYDKTDRPFTITKVTDKTIFIERKYESWGGNKTRFKVGEMVADYKHGLIIRVETDNDIKELEAVK